ncbi:MAG: alpha/beta hydrolase-fold protein [Candidatus Acidiferrum sp.]
MQSKILGHMVRYCVLLPPSYDSQKTKRYPVLYLLHGLGDDEQMLLRSGAFNLVEDLWERKEIDEFLMVTPGAGASFYVNARDGKNRYEDFFVQEFLPAIEQRYRIRGGRTLRGIAGISMGGYGALHMAFRHAQLFGSVGAHSAALFERPPVVNIGHDAESRQPARVRILGGVFGAPVDVAFWKQNDPIQMARTSSLAGLKIYFDCGSEDDYGFDAGANELDKALSARHIAHEFHLHPGGHNWPYFAEHLPALLKFHSAVFASAKQ